jgi:ABC-type branched-chain amino acid transport systems, ATPase component
MIENQLIDEARKNIDNLYVLLKEIEGEGGIEQYFSKKEIIFQNDGTLDSKIKMCEEQLSQFIINAEDCKKFLSEVKGDLPSYDKYDEAYQIHVNQKIKEITDKSLNFIIHIPKNSVQLWDFNYQFKNFFQDTMSNLDLSTIRAFENFKFKDVNYAIFGKNGAGKTTLLKKISEELLNSNSYVISADRNITPQGRYNVTHGATLTYALNRGPEAIYSLLQLLRDMELQAFRENKNLEVKLSDQYYSIFNSLGLERELKELNGMPYLNIIGGDEHSQYQLKEGSDGEIAVAYLILAVLLLPQNSYLFIDEPEKHLNGALMKKLFDRLELERPDVRFIYLTHVINFIETRKNVKLVYLEKTNQVDKWEFQPVDDVNSLDLNIILNVEGTSDDILFCEGIGTNSIDYQIYSSVFNNLSVVQCNSCEQVITNTKGLNNDSRFIKRKVFGIIDNDFREEGEIGSLANNKITVLEYSEIENLLIDSEILESVNDELNKVDLSDLKNKVIQVISKKKITIMNDYLDKRFLKNISAQKLKFGEGLDEQISKLNKSNQDNLIEKVKLLEQKFDKFVSENSYDKLIRLVPAKGIYNLVAHELGLSNEKFLTNKVVSLINTNSGFKNMIESKINLRL